MFVGKSEQANENVIKQRKISATLSPVKNNKPSLHFQKYANTLERMGRRLEGAL